VEDAARQHVREMSHRELVFPLDTFVPRSVVRQISRIRRATVDVTQIGRPARGQSAK